MIAQIRTHNGTRVRELVTLWHSSHTAPAGFRVAFFLLDGEDTIGVSTWGRPVARMEDQLTKLEHTRMALAPGSPPNSASWFLAANRAVIRTDLPEVKRLIAYVDGTIHSGVSYRADNWHEVSQGVSTNSWGTRPDRVGRPCALRVKFERKP